MRPWFARQRFVCGALLLWFSALYAATANRPLWGDEAPIVDTIGLFGRGISVEFLRTYPEMNSPLVFMVYAGWGTLVGFELWKLRILSAVLAFATSWIFYRILDTDDSDWKTTMLTLATIVLNPYFIGLSAFVFTDMLAIFMMVLAWYAVQRQRIWIAGLATGASLLTRQYFAFVVPAVAGAVLLGQSSAKRRAVAETALALTIGLLPFAALVWLWQGLSPVNFKRALYLQEPVRYDLHALSLYLAVPAVYLLPLIVWRAWHGMRWSSLVAGAIAALLVAVFPVKASMVQTAQGVFTVGFVHRLLVATVPPTGVSLAFFVMAVVWLSVAIDCVRDALIRWRRAPPRTSEVVPLALVFAFLLVMPFSYMPWEKYAMPLFIAAAAMLVDTPRRL